MEKIKEKIITLRKWSLNGYKNDTYNECLDIINQELQDCTFIRVPRKIKLSEVKSKVEVSLKNGGFDFEDANIFYSKWDNSYVWRSYGGSEIKFCIENNMIIHIDINFTMRYFEWLYEMWLAQTEIEVDV